MNRIESSSKSFHPPLQLGDIFPSRALEVVSGSTLHIPDESRIVHLQLRRFAGCPICNVHLRGFARHADALHAAGILEVAVFHSSVESLRPVHADLPFPIVADPERRLYAELGVGTSLRAVLDPRAWAAAARALASGAGEHASAGREDGSLGLPGDFLLAPDGRIVALHRGVHADDQWSVEEVLALARQHRATLPHTAGGAPLPPSAPTTHGEERAR